MKTPRNLRRTSESAQRDIVRDTKQPVVVNHIGVRTLSPRR